MIDPTLDLSALRAFVTGIELGSFARAARRLRRSPPAISAQLRKLEQQAGQPLVRRQGRGVAPTEVGETMLAYGRRLLALNDEAMAALRVSALAGTVRLGMPQDFAEGLLADVLGQFVRAHPHVRIEARVEPHTAVSERLRDGRLDVALSWGDPSEAPTDVVERLLEVPMQWYGAAGTSTAKIPREPEGVLPLVLFEPPCVFRQAALGALDRAGVPWRIAVSGPALAGLWAAVAAGLGVTARVQLGAPAAVVPLAASRNALPALPMAALWLHCPGRSPAAMHLADLIRSALGAGPFRQDSATPEAPRVL